MRPQRIEDAIREEIRRTKDAAFNDIQPGDIHSWDLAKGTVLGLSKALDTIKTAKREQEDELS